MWQKHTATIIFRGLFPIDMLRYDDCFPMTGEDAYRITRSLTERGWGKQEVQLCAYSERKKHWTIGRWGSFMCDVKEPRAEKA